MSAVFEAAKGDPVIATMVAYIVIMGGYLIGMGILALAVVFSHRPARPTPTDK